MAHDLEIITETTDIADTSIATTMARAEIDVLISTARAYPRSIARAQQRMIDLATIDEEAADDAIYSLPRAGKAIEGPSVRFSELAVQSWGNARVAARTTVIDRIEKFVEAEGVFLDAETNVATLARVRRRISDKYGKVYNDDMILVTCNAAQSIARRNAILAGIPKQVWRKPYEAARRVIMGDIITLANRRADAIKAFQRFGITAEQILALLAVKGIEDIDQEKLVPLRGMYSSLHNQDISVEELLRSIEPEKPQRVTPSTANHSAPAAFVSDDVPIVDAKPMQPDAIEQPVRRGRKPGTKNKPKKTVSEPDASPELFADPVPVVSKIMDDMAEAVLATDLATVWDESAELQVRLPAAERDRLVIAYQERMAAIGAREAAE